MSQSHSITCVAGDDDREYGLLESPAAVEPERVVAPFTA
jgi:hypothetical protein